MLRRVGLLAILGSLPAGVGAECVALQPLASLSAEQRSQPVAQQFVRLLDQDRFNDVPKSILAWSALIKDAERDPATPVEILARANGWLAWSLDYVDRVDEASNAANKADSLLRAANLQDAPFASEIGATLSMVQIDSGKPEIASGTATHALAVADRWAPESAAASYVHNAVANVAYAGGRYADAEREYGIATALAERCLAPENGFIVNQMASHAGVLYMAGRSEDALAENERAANWALAHLDERSPVVTLALGNLGVMLRSAGRYPEAEAALRRVVDLEARYQHDSWYYRAISLSNFASVIDRQGRHSEAEALWVQSSEWHKNATTKRDPATRAYPLRYSADAAQARGDLPLAIARREEAIRLMTPDIAADHPELARARIELARSLALTGRAPEGLRLAMPAIAIVQRKLDANDVKRLTAEIDYARVVAAASGAVAGDALIRPIADRLEAKLLDSATSRGDLLRYGAIFSASFATVTELALATGQDERAFHALQLANLSDIVLVNSEVAARTAAGDGAAAKPLRTLQDRVRERQSLDRARTFAAASGKRDELARIDTALAENDRQSATAAHELDRVFPAYRALGRPIPVTLAAFRARLARDEMLLAPLPTDDGTLAIVVTRDGLNWRKSAVTRAGISSLVERIRGSIDRARTDSGAGGAFDLAAARQLYGALLPPSLPASATKRRDILYYSAGTLATVPAALLVAPSASGATRWLIRTHSVTVLPTLERPAANAGMLPEATRFLGIGAPDRPTGTGSSAVAFRGGGADDKAIASLPALPHAERELRRIGTLVGGESMILTGPTATEDAVRRAASGRFGVVAIATHALGGGSFAGINEPALVLSRVSDKESEDGLLTASDIAGLRLEADWVILSACDTASGTGSGSPAYSGLASAFMQAGAQALLVSHWPVRDDAAERLTVTTVRETRTGLSRARALQQAMLATMADRHLPNAAHPANWAPFVLIER